MAIIKQIELGNGYLPEYHKINDIKGNKIEVLTFKDKLSRDNNKNPIMGNDIIMPEEFSEADLKLEGNSPKVLAYAYIKTLPEYEGAIDD